MSELYKMFSESIKSDNIKSGSVNEIYRLYSESEDEKTFPSQTVGQIENWERIHKAVLPEEYKEFLLLSDGLVSDIFGGELFPLDEIIPCPAELTEEYSDGKNDYFIIGNYIGDGSILLCDRAGKFYKFDHCFGIEEDSLLNFLEYWYNNN